MGGAGSAGGAGGQGGAGMPGGSGGAPGLGEPGAPGEAGKPPDYVVGEVNIIRTDVEQVKLETKWLMDTMNSLLTDLQGGWMFCFIYNIVSIYIFMFINFND